MRNNQQLILVISRLLPFRLRWNFTRSLQGQFKNQPIRLLTSLAFFMLVSLQGFAQLPTESFESGVPADWTIINNSIGTSDWGATTDGYLGTNAVTVDPSADNIGDQNTAEYFLVTPQITIPANGEIHFFTKQGDAADNGTIYELRLSTANQPDVNGFSVLLDSWTEADLNSGSQTAYEEKVVEFPDLPAIPVYVAFVAINTQNGATPTGDAWFVDDVSVIEGCSAVVEDTFVIENITPEGADLSWSHPTATNFEVQVIPAGGVPADTGGVPVSGSSLTVDGLDSSTAFDVYIQAVCPNGSVSDLSGPFNFTTLNLGTSCDFPIVVPDVLSGTPYVLADNLANYGNPDVVYDDAGTGCVANPGGANGLNGDKIFLSYTATQDALITITQDVSVTLPEGNCWNDNTTVYIYDGCSNVGVSCLDGTYTTGGIQQNQIENFLVQAGQTYIIVVSAPYAPGAGICFELEIEGSSCAAPSGITYDDLTENSVLFSWDNVGGFADSWEYTTVPTGNPEPTGAGTATATNVDNLINTGLVAGTTYDFYVRSVCGGTSSEWSAPFTFTTQCTTFDTPYSTEFASVNSTTPEPCWNIIDVNMDLSTWKYSFGYASISTGTNQGNNNDIFVSPRINFTGPQKRLRFKQRNASGVSTYSIWVSTTGVGADNFTTQIYPETEISTGFNWEEVIVNIPTSVTGEVNIGWVVSPNANETANSLNIDDVVVEDIPACPNPLDITVDNITGTSADISWTQGFEETQWEIAIQDAGTGEPTGSGTLVTENDPYQAIDLLPAHQYEVYVRAYCNSTEQSEWIGPVSFETLCTVFDTPFFESFDDGDPNTHKFCWSTNNANMDNGQWAIAPNFATTQAPFFFPPTSFDDWLISPAINVDGVKELKFDYRSAFSFFFPTTRFGLEVLISTTDTDPSSFTVIEPYFEFTNTVFQEKSVLFEATGTVYIAFRIPPEFSTAEGYSVLDIDNVSINDAPNCPMPSDIQVSGITQNAADITWTAGFNESSWNIALQPAGTGVPPVSSENTLATGYSVSDLEPATTYEVYVQAVCDSENSEWVGPVTFTTLCEAFTTPFIETFDSDSMTEDCWRIVDDNDDNQSWQMDSAVYPYEGDQSAAMFTGQNGANEDWLISPTITVTANQRLRYYYRVNDSFFTEDLEVLLSTNGINIEDFTTVLYDSDNDPVIINNMVYLEKIINLPDGITGDINIAFHVPYFESTGPYRGQLLFIDNVVIEDIPECPEPSNIMVNNITDTTIDVSWDANGSETSWEIAVLPYQEDAPVGDVDPQYLYTATASPYTVTGLDAATKYEVYVRAVCDDDTNSEWIGPVEVNTKCSFDNLCQYTFTLTSDVNLSASIDVYQNEELVQSLPFDGNPAGEFTVFLCTGVEFSLYFETLGTAQSQYDNFQVSIEDYLGNNVYTSPMGVGPLKTFIYTDVAECGPVSCPQPTDLTASATSVLSWTAGGSETQWEVAIQPIDNGTLPQSGTIVSTNSYSPTADDFFYDNAATYEFYVRAICGDDDNSYWSGPYDFVRNDDASTALALPINEDLNCVESAFDVSFRNASVSSEAITCPVTNQADVWFQFTATSRIHIIEANDFPGSFYVSSGEEPFPFITMTLYHELGDGTLEELSCSDDNVIVASYSSELVVGDSYKVRITLNDPAVSTKKFKVCLTTPEDLCAFNAVNYDFERQPYNGPSGIYSISSSLVVPGWRKNMETEHGQSIFIWESLNAPGFTPYSGGQCIQLISDDQEFYDENDPIIRGLYREFDTSEITLMDYSFATQARFDGNTIQLYAGPPQGPFTLLAEQVGVVGSWTLVNGSYEVPDGQDVTRFIFRAKNYDIGVLLDAANFIPNNDIELLSQDQVVDCNNPTAELNAEGTGTWTADENNPGEVIISDPNSKDITVSGFTASGTYVFTWGTRYCQEQVSLEYNGIPDVPTVTSPTEYCLGDEAEPLTATPSENYTLLWYTEPTGGTGVEVAPTPDTSVTGTTTYYVANTDASTGCTGERIEIVVNVNQTIVPEVAFSYETVCDNDSDNPFPQTGTDFTTGGIFSSFDLTVDSDTGEVDLTNVAPGVYEVTYTFDGDSVNCTLSDSYTTTIEITACNIPRGISPNGDGANDSFVLNGVREVHIFNRYGTEVYKFVGAYTDQWHGQSNKGDDLPDGTYFYSITKNDGSSVTGWVYIIK
ncbi:choice-of-anchor J domain-containing protein [Mangrovimonas aestuarii]|uniref:choice-of-anchor J domain-containing protein n=1 Tax=Mangrovimonas aestuarii TaxID=3018443 RepID=UPI002379BA4C|nr:choice-of-anchor J domain-containing protein [Mangrovimonas aestuarii]